MFHSIPAFVKGRKCGRPGLGFSRRQKPPPHSTALQGRGHGHVLDQQMVGAAGKDKNAHHLRIAEHPHPVRSHERGVICTHGGRFAPDERHVWRVGRSHEIDDVGHVPGACGPHHQIAGCLRHARPWHKRRHPGIDVERGRR